MRHLLFSIFASVSVLFCHGQNQPLKNMIEEGRARGEKFNPVKPLVHSTIKQVAGYGNYHVLSISQDVITKILNEAPSSVLLQLPVSENQLLETELLQVDNGFVNNITLNNTTKVLNTNVPLFYRGIIKGYQGKSSVAFTLSPDMLSIFISYPGNTLTIKKSEDPTLLNQYILYNSKEISFPSPSIFECGTADMPLAAISNNPHPAIGNRPASPADFSTACVYIFYDCDDSLYRHFNSSVTQVTNYVYSIFNQIALAYQNEGIKVKISKINVWTTASPFLPGQLIETFGAYYQENFFGNIAVCLDWGNIPGRKAGIAGAIGRVKADNSANGCTGYTPGNGFRVGAFAYCDLNYFGNYQNFPVATDALQVYLVTHEMGHLLGSGHTHWCGWLLSTDPNVYGALDNCVGVEGSCAAGPAPVNGGTMMSYCIYDGQYVNFNNGFGQKPGDAIRNFIGNSICLLNCPTCFPGLTLGNLASTTTYHYEASNTITINGQVTSSTIVNLDAGGKITFLPGFKASLGCTLKAYIEGCGGVR